MRRLLASLLFQSLLLAAHAEHLPGGTMSYTCLGGNMYEITLALPRYCSGTEMLPHALKFTNNCGVNFSVQGIMYDEVIDHHPQCAEQAGNTTCDGGSEIGLRTYIFRYTLYLSPCSGWAISWSVCCRPEALNLIGNPGIYVEARLDNTGGACNDSPAFQEHTLPFVCVGQTVHYDPFVVETDGDSLSYSLIDARYAGPAPTPVFYQPGFTGMAPYPGLTLDPTSGQITFTPDQVGQVVVAVQVNEYRNGAWIGSAMRDFTFVATPCDNTIPPISDGALTVLSGDVTLTGPYTFETCAGTAGSVQAVFTDPDPGQLLTIWSTVEAVLPGATMSLSGTNPVEMTIAWDDLAAAAGTRHFGVKALDDHCLYRGLQTYSYTAHVLAFPAALPPGDATICANHPPVMLADSLSAPLPDGGAWSAPDGSAHSGQFDPDNDEGGIYTYTLNAGSMCPWTTTVAVIVLPETEPVCIGLGVSARSGAALRAWPNPANGQLHVEGLPMANGLPPVLELMDLHGRVLWTDRPMGGTDLLTIDLPAYLPSGTYLLRPVSTHGAARPIRFVVAR